jgi:hypothetical protein
MEYFVEPEEALGPQGRSMKVRAALVLCVLLGGAPSPCFSQPPQSATAYALLVDRLKAGDRAVDFTELRMAFTRTPEYRGMMMGFYQPLWRTLNSGDFAGALRVAETVLRQNYVEPNAHMVAARAHRELGHAEQAEFHQFVVDGLLRSITSKGDGATAETAYQVIDISEEYALFRSMDVSVKSQSLVVPPAGGRPFVDRMVVVDGRTNEEKTLFFSVDSPTTIRR